MRIGVDIDQVLNNMLEKIIPIYNQKYDDTLLFGDITGYDLRPFIKPECKNIFSEFANDELIMSLEMAPDAVHVLTELSTHHDLYFVTAGHPYTMRARDDWLQKHLPFYKSRQLIGCCDKHLLNIDVLIDDYEDNLIGGHYYKLLFDKPWNKHVSTRIFNIKRIFDWGEVPDIIAQISERHI